MSYRPNRETGGPGPSSSINMNGGYNILEQQNDEMVEELSSKVSQLKRVTIAIGDDVREQNRLLNEMDRFPIVVPRDTKFETTKGLLGSTMKKLGIVSKAGGRNVLCYLVLFCFFVFLVIYFLMR
uniref:t-SNARE coiled-coil homology domain-containing protein n=1 Tax=Meloidogyne javanica TaxID=6303 RepID=A0A915LXP4_MELJA